MGRVQTLPTAPIERRPAPRRRLRRRNLALLAAIGVLVAVAIVWQRAGAIPVVRTMSVAGAGSALAIDAQTRRAFVLSNVGATLSELNTQTGTLLRTLALRGAGSAMAIDTATARVFIGLAHLSVAGASSLGGAVVLLNAHDGTVVRTVPVGPSPSAIAVDERSGRVFVATATRKGGRVYVLDGVSGAVLRTVDVGHNTHRFIYNPGLIGPCGLAVDERLGRLIVVGGGNSGLSTLDAATGRVVRTTRNSASVCYGTGQALAVDSRTGRGFSNLNVGLTTVVDTWNTRTGLLLHGTAGVSGGAPLLLAVDERHGHVFASGTVGGGVQMLDAHSGAILHTLLPGQYVVAIALDTTRNRAYLLSRSAAPVSGSNLWAWVPAPVRRWLPFLAARPSNSVFGGSVSVLDTRSGAVMRAISLPTEPEQIAVDERSGYVYVLSSGTAGKSTVNVLDLAS